MGIATISLTQLTQNAIDAISLGSLYALLALGIALIFGIMRLINFAHGELLMIGAYSLVLLDGIPFVPRVAIMVAVVVLFALLMERVAFRPLRSADPATLLVASFAVSYLLQNVATLIFGSVPRATNVSSALSESFTIGQLSISKLDVLTVSLTALLLVALSVFFSRSTVGYKMRAAAENFDMARLLGVRANSVIALAFLLSGVLAAAGAFIITTQTGTVSPTVGTSYVLVAFVATIVGGIGSLLGAVIGGFSLGVVTVVLQVALPESLRPYRDAFVYAVVLLVLVVRPQGLIVAATARLRAEGIEAYKSVATAGRVLQSLRERVAGLAVLLALVGGVTLLGSLSSGSVQATILTMLINLVLVVGLFAFTGNSGIFSFGYIAFAAIGAYTSGILLTEPALKQALYDGMPGFLQSAHMGPVGATLVAGLVAVAVAVPLALPLMRLSGLVASLGTFAVLVIVNVVSGNWKQVTNADQGLAGIPQSLGLGTAFLWTAGAIVLVFCFQQTRACLRLRATREDESAAQSVGVRVSRDRTYAFLLSAFVAGVGGALFAQQLGAVVPNALYLSEMFLLVAMLVVGGIATLSGAVIGTLALTVVSEVLRRFETGADLGLVHVHAPVGLQQVGFALAMLLILIRRPTGITRGRELPIAALAGAAGLTRVSAWLRNDDRQAQPAAAAPDSGPQPEVVHAGELLDASIHTKEIDS